MLSLEGVERRDEPAPFEGEGAFLLDRGDRVDALEDDPGTGEP